MSIKVQERIDIEQQAFVSDGSKAIDAAPEIAPQGRPEPVIYIENAGDFPVPLAAIKDVHAGKVILDRKKLDTHLRGLTGHAHDAEIDIEPGT